MIYGCSTKFLALYGNAIVMQYTGLKDRYGRDIYEGDILATDGRGFCDGQFDLGTVVATSNAMGYCFYWDWQNDHYSETDYLEQPGLAFVEAVGNIYENPELLEQAA